MKILLLLMSFAVSAWYARAATSKTTTTKTTTTETTTTELSTSEAKEKQGMESDLGEIGREIDQLQARAKKSSGDAKTAINERVDALEAKRVELKKQMSAAGDTSGRAWVKARKGLVRAMNDLKSAFKDAKNEFNKSDKTPEE